MKIKVCGLAKVDQVKLLHELGVDYFGLIFYPNSPRYALNYLTLNEIKSLQDIYKIGVFVNEKLEDVVRVAQEAQLNAIQFHGEESNSYLREVSNKLSKSVHIIKVIRIGNQSVTELQKSLEDLPEEVNFILFDTDSKQYGGTGESFSWKLLDQLNIRKPYFLSGGISLENIHQVSQLRNQPYAIDINSKFEVSPGVKDINSVNKLLHHIKN